MSSPSSRHHLGRKRNSGKPRLRLTPELLMSVNVTPPAAVDYYSKVPTASWGMDGNDQVGDCTCAEVDHAVKAMQVAGGNPEVTSTTAEVMAAYSAITGYDAADPSTDRGAEMQDVRNYWRKTGFTLGGQVDKILLFAEIDAKNTKLVEYCLDRFGEVGLGIQCPQSAQQQCSDKQPWTVVRNSPVEGGHAIALVGYDDDYYYVVTWGTVQPMTPGFYAKYVEEAWISVSPDFVNAVSKADPLGESLDQLGQEFAVLTGEKNPVASLRG
jgi:hypothetical protein